MIAFNDFSRAFDAVNDAIPSYFSRYNAQDCYDNPSLLVSEGISVLWHVKNNRENIIKPEIIAPTDILWQHTEDYYAKNNETAVLNETMASYPVTLASSRLQKEIVINFDTDLKSQSLPKDLRNDQNRAVKLLAQCSQAINDNQSPNIIKYLQTIEAYISEYYQERANTEQLARFVFEAVKLKENVESPFSEDVRAKIGEFAEQLLIASQINPLLEQRRAQAEQLLGKMGDAKISAYHIAQAQIPELLAVGGTLHKLSIHIYGAADAETVASVQADPNQWLFNQDVKETHVAAFLLVMDDLAANNQLKGQLKEAYEEIRGFIVEVLPEWYENSSLWRGKNFAESIQKDQDSIRLLWSVGKLEPQIKALTGLEADVLNRGFVSKKKLLNYAAILAGDEQMQASSDGLNIQNWLEKKMVSGGFSAIGHGILDAQEMLKDPTLSAAGRSALQHLLDVVDQHFIAMYQQYPIAREGAVLEPERSLKYCRIERNKADIEKIPSLEGVSEFICSLDHMKINTPEEHKDSFEQWYLGQAKNQGQIMELARYLALAEVVIATGEETQKKAAALVADYLHYYADAAGESATEPNSYTYGYKTQFEDCYQRAQKLEKQGLKDGLSRFLNSFSDVAEAVKLLSALNDDDNQDGQYIKRYITYHYNILDKELPSLQARSATDFEPVSASATVLSKQDDFRNTPELIQQLGTDATTVMWGCAYWLAKLEKERLWDWTAVNKNPDMKSASIAVENYIEAEFTKLGRLDELKALSRKMYEGLAAMEKLDGNNHTLKYLCVDSLNDQSSNEYTTPLQCAITQLLLQEAIDSDLEKSAAANKALSFVQEAILHAGLEPQTTKIAAYINHFVENALQHLDFLPHESIQDRKWLIQAFQYSHIMAEYVSIAEYGVMAIENNEIMVDPSQLQALNNFSNVVLQSISNGNDVAIMGDDFKGKVKENLAEKRVDLALQLIIKAELPELSDLQAILSDPEEITSYSTASDLLRYGSLREKKPIPNLPERFLVGVMKAKESGRNFTPTLNRAIDEVVSYVTDSFTQSDNKHKSGYMQRVAQLQAKVQPTPVRAKPSMSL